MESSATWKELLSRAHAWHVRPGELTLAALEKRGGSWLSEDEREHRERLGTDVLRREHLASRMLRRGVLSRHTGVEPRDWRFANGPHGKPEIAAPVEFISLRFNMTHTVDFIACMVSRAGEVGIDAEDTSRRVDVDEIARHFFSGEERLVLSALPADRQTEKFFEYWVLKEAYLKGRGTGLSVSPETFTIRFDNDGNPQPMDGWQLALHRPTARYVVATAIRGERVVPIEWRAMDSLL
jgi:4'-phosphopantetheinyl transferase